MSAAEKRRKKKLEKRGEAPTNEDDVVATAPSAGQTTEDQLQPKSKTKGAPQPKLLRGQKGKLKKMKKKYAEQDDEERALRIQLLQSEGLRKKEEQRRKEEELLQKQKRKLDRASGRGRGGALPPHQNAQQAGRGRGRGSGAASVGQQAGPGQQPPVAVAREQDPLLQEEEEEETEELQAAEEKVVAAEATADVEHAGAPDQGGKPDKEDDDGAGGAVGEVAPPAPEDEADLEAKRKRRQEKRHEKKKEAEEIRQIMEEENIKALDESLLLSEVDALTGLPLADDALLFAVPVCAPYSVVQNYKYKVKLVPGSVKRGKAAKDAMSYFLSFPEATDRERDLLKAVEDSEIVQQLMGNVRIATSGLKQKAKGGKKKK